MNTEGIYVKGILIKESDTDERRTASIKLPVCMVIHYVSCSAEAVKGRRPTIRVNYIKENA